MAAISPFWRLPCQPMWMSIDATWLPAVAGIVGTLAGVALTQLSLGRRDDRRWQLEREHERTIWARDDANRTYDHRRQAYIDFLTEADRLKRTCETAIETGNTDRPSDDAFDVLTDRWTAVHVYGSEKGADLASQCLENLRLWAWNLDDDGLADDVLQFWNQYVEQVRRDLGVPHGPAAERSGTEQ